MRRLTTSSVTVAMLALSGCIENGNPAPPRNETIGPDGGTFNILQDIVLVVPPGALSADTVFFIDEARSDAPPVGRIVVGTAFEFAPADLAFAMPSQILMPYHASWVSSVVADDELVVAQRDAAGSVTDISPSIVDQASGRVTFETGALGTFWVTAPDVVSAVDLFPLNDGDEYRFEDNVVIEVQRTTTEPNFDPAEVVKLTISQAGVELGGIYLDDSGSELRKLGEFLEPVRQEILRNPVLLIAEREDVGAMRTATEIYDGFRPFGETTVSYQGLAETTTTIAERVDLTVGVGQLRTVRVPVRTRFDDTSPAQGERIVELYLAMGLGPAAVALTADAQPSGLLGGVLDGEPMLPP